MTLPDHCLSVPGCQAPRLRYAGYCQAHGPAVKATAKPRCVAPLRCYCPRHSQLERDRQGPTMGPQVARLVLAHARQQASPAVASPIVLPVTERFTP